MSKLGNKSICGKCEYYRSTYNDIHWCEAFPPVAPFNGIPEKYTSGKEEHRKKDKDQITDAVFKEILFLPEM